MCTLYTVSNKTITNVRGSAEQLPQDLGGTTLNPPRLGPSGRIVLWAFQWQADRI